MMKKGISLIVLVITIIVMIILAASVVITLSNTGVINRASEAVDLTNEAAVQDMAALIWADAYMDNKRGTDLVNEVTTKLGEQGVTSDKWNITVTDTGISVTNKNSSTTLGSLIKGPEDYGKTVDYTVTADVTFYQHADYGSGEIGTTKTLTISEWQIYYHNNDYVYLIAKEPVGETLLSLGTSPSSLTAAELELYEKFRVGTADKYALTSNSMNIGATVQMIKDYSSFANKALYGENVVGAIGGPTLELFVAGWNSKGYTPTFTLSTEERGYKINEQNENYPISVTSDGLYVLADNGYWLSSPGYYDIVADDFYYVGLGKIYAPDCTTSNKIRPVVCLKASIPATTGTGDYDFSLVK